jgi:hypothetical protein
VDEQTVLVNNYRRVDPQYGDRVRRIMKRARLDCVEVPYAPVNGESGGIPWAVGCYVNFLHAGDVIMMPAFRMAEDASALRVLEGVFPKNTIRMIDCESDSPRLLAISRADFPRLSPVQAIAPLPTPCIARGHDAIFLTPKVSCAMTLRHLQCQFSHGLRSTTPALF